MMQWLGRSPEMFRYSVKESISDHYLSKTFKAFTSEILFDNSYIEYILYGTYNRSFPYYLRPAAIGKLKSKTNPVEIRTGHILDVLREKPENSFSKYNLSDVFEPLQEKETDLIFHEIMRTGRKDARIIFWNNLVKRDINKELATYFLREEKLEKQLREKEKVFFYADLNIYTLIK
jgi:S-adenosylmethionine-diacylglycerol 3-amino-3-carboxypropyl transferase